MLTDRAERAWAGHKQYLQGSATDMRLKRAAHLSGSCAGIVRTWLISFANAAAPTVSGAGHDQMAGKGKSTFTLIYRGGFRGGGFHGGGAADRRLIAVAFTAATALRAGTGFYGGVRRAHWGGGRYWGGAGWRRAGWYGGLGRGWGVRRAGWYGGWRRPGWGWRRAGWYGGLGPRMGLAACWLVWWLASSRMGLAPRWLVGLGAAGAGPLA